ncbi:MAG: lipoate--protein ligase family protein [Ignavibacteriales bacterium]|nr:lipoate--protein ligase family protein [Ignavibacteriales bacterium]
MEWQFINTGMSTGEFNMKYDVDLTQRLVRGEIPQTVRVYGWKPWAVSLGYNQSELDIDQKKCTEYGFDIVRRPTGGRAILHATEITYSVVMFADGKGITDVYSSISKALVNGLQLICPRVGYETSQPNFRQLYRQQESIPCFSSSARYEVKIEGKKLVGSAQRRFSTPNGEEIVLQHGSILLGPEHKLLSEILNIDNDEIRKKVNADFNEKTIDLSFAAGRTIFYDEVVDCIKSGFENTLNINFISLSETHV